MSVDYTIVLSLQVFKTEAYNDKFEDVLSF